MTAAPPPEPPPLVERSFAAEPVRRGLALVDRVHVVKPPPWPVVARVAGEVVTVHYRAEATLLRGECTCAVGADCEHAVALALVALALDRERAAAEVEVARQHVVGEWLVELARAQDAPAPAPGGGGDQVIVYLLDGRDADLGLNVVPCARLRGGGLAPGAPLAASTDRRGAPAWIDTDDLRRIATLRAVARALPATTRLRLDRVDGPLLEELAGTGRLRWARVDGPPLTWGPTRRERLGWRPGDDPAGFRIGLPAPLIVISAHAPHYLDPIAGVIGPLALDVAPGLVGRLVAMPPVPAPMRATVERSLTPLAVALDGAAAAAEPFRPCLTAGLDPDARNTLVVTAEAGYGDDRYPLAVWDPARPAARDLVGEGRARARLDRMLADLPHRLAAGSSVQLLANARAFAHLIAPALRADGWRCVLADSFPVEGPAVEVTWIERLRPVGEPARWFALELGVDVEGRTVPLLPILLDAIRGGQIVLEPGGGLRGGAGVNLRLPEGELVYLPADRLARWLAPLVELELRGVDATGELRLPPMIAARLDADDAGPALAGARAQLDALLALAPAEPPAGFVGTLRPYQRLGLAWLRLLHDAGLGGLLADDMGLGKTVQILAFLAGLELDGDRPALVVAPRSVIGNWAAEAARFVPGLRSAIHLGADRPDDPRALAPLTLTSYQTLVRDRELLGAIRWRTVFFDESQAVKNPDTQLRAAAATLVADSRFTVTGTPIENHLGELWSQLDLAIPGVLGRRRGFDTVYRKPIERDAADGVMEHLRQRVRPFLLRRTKQHVEVELPPRTEIVERIDLDVAQRDLYESLRLSLDAGVQRALDQARIPGASMQILDALLKLRQCCCDPRLIKLPAARRVDSSAKLERLLAKLVELDDAGRSTLVFSQFTSMLTLIERACAEAGLATLKLTGATRDREDVVARFQAGAARIFLVSLKAGGVGLNLTRADTVIHYDPWWNPAAEAQASDRAHRIGQDRPVVIYKLVARGTVEDAICDLQDDKRRLSSVALRDGGVTHLAPGDLAAVYRYAVHGA